MKTIYIAGKVTGEPRDICVQKFNAAEELLRSKGFTEIGNPVTMVPEHYGWKEAMQICIIAVMASDCIFLLDDWQESKGARLEKTIAEHFGLEIIEQKNFI